MLNRFMENKLIFLFGKGGVGKSLLAQAVAEGLSQKKKKVLWVRVLQITDRKQELQKKNSHLSYIELNSRDCFEEYIVLKLKLKPLYSLFLNNKVTTYLEKAAPGVREMVLLGKIWFERANYDHIVIDMPSTGYAMTMFSTPFHFSNLFPGGPIYNDAQAIIQTLSDPTLTSYGIVSLLEEMPAQESLEFEELFHERIPENPAWLLANRKIEIPKKHQHVFQEYQKRLASTDRSNPLWRALQHRIHQDGVQQKLLNRLKKEWRNAKNILVFPEMEGKTEAEKVKGILNFLKALQKK